MENSRIYPPTFLFTTPVLLLLMIGCSIINDGDDPGDGFTLDLPGYPSPYMDPSVSPDGQIVVFHRTKITRLNSFGGFSFDPDSTGIWMVRMDGTGLKLLVQGMGLYNPVFSPDGQWLAYNANAQIYKAPFDGDSVDVAGTVQLTTEGRNFFPAWSPDGQWIAYDRSIADQTGPMGVWMMKTDGSKKKPIFGGAMPTWHPDGQSFLAVKGTSSTSIWTRFVRYYPFDNRTSETLNGVVDNENLYPKYSPDGLRILFQSSDRSGSVKIWIMNSDGRNPKPVADKGLTPTWTPAGQIVYERGMYSGYHIDNGTLWVMNADGRGKRQLTFNHGLELE